MENVVSVIVPVYNTKQYIFDCVRSVLQQTYTAFELILVDDGSSDGSREICEKLCTQDKRIRLLRQEHKGVSAARNSGLNAACGEWLFFLDSDDMIHPRSFEILCKLQKENHTAVSSVGLYYAEEREFVEPADWKGQIDIKKESSVLYSEYSMKHPVFTHARTKLYAIGGKMISREAVGTLRFDEELTHGEDTWFMFQVLANGADVSILFRNWYYYRRHKANSGRKYSMETCISRYKAEQYIRDYRVRTGRISDAKYNELNLLTEIVLWYEMGKRQNDVRLISYVENLMEEEKRTWIFSQLKWYQRSLFLLGCDHYGLYGFIKKMIRGYYSISDRFYALIDRDIV